MVVASFDAFESVTLEPASLAEVTPEMAHGAEVVRSSLDDAIASPPLRERLEGVERLTIVVPDATRTLNAEVVEGVLSYVAEHGEPGIEVRILVATGLHRPPTSDEMATGHLAQLVASGHEVVIHNARSARPVPVKMAVTNPATGDVVPVWLNPLVTDVDLVITLSHVELHQYAGFSGGFKPITIGCGGVRTIAEVHGLPILRMPGTQIGRLAGNPFQAMLNRIGNAAAPVFSVQMAESRRGTSYVSGDPEVALNLLARHPGARFYTEVGEHDAAMVLVEATKGVNLYQASRAYTYLTLQEHPPLAPGAPVLVVAPCPEGMGRGAGERAFAAALEEGLSALAELLEHGRDRHASGGRQRAFVIARAAQKHPLHLLCAAELPPAVIPRGIRVHRTLDEAVTALREDAPLSALQQDMRVLVTRDIFRALPRHAKKS